MYDELVRSDDNFVTLGWGEKWKGFMDKFTHMIDYLSNVDNPETCKAPFVHERDFRRHGWFSFVCWRTFYWVVLGVTIFFMLVDIYMKYDENTDDTNN